MIRFTFLSVKSHQVAAGWCTRKWLRFDQTTQRVLHVESTSIRCGYYVKTIRRPNFDEFPRHFHVLLRCNFADWKIHVVSMYFFRSNFDGRKIHVVSTYFFRCNFDGRKIHLASTCFFNVISFIEISMCFYLLFWCNFDGRIIRFVCTDFFRWNFDEFDIVVGKL